MARRSSTGWSPPARRSTRSRRTASGSVVSCRRRRPTTSSTTRESQPRRTARTSRSPAGLRTQRRGVAGWLPRLYALDVKTGWEMLFPTAKGTGSRGSAVYSPDGKLVAYARIHREGAFQLVIANADGSGNERTIGPKKPGRHGRKRRERRLGIRARRDSLDSPLRDRRCRSDAISCRSMARPDGLGSAGSSSSTSSAWPPDQSDQEIAKRPVSCRATGRSSHCAAEVKPFR